MKIGANLINDENVEFRVYAPLHDKVYLTIEENINNTFIPKFSILLNKEDENYHSIITNKVKPNDLYRYKLTDNNLYPDPASRFQPYGPHNPSQVIDPTFNWTDQNFKTPIIQNQIIYELHIGTFTKRGTWKEALKYLPYLQDLGITIIEMMPVADFDGAYGWGYDLVNFFAPSHLYGSPSDLKEFINRAHDLNISVLLDAVYNHMGCSGNYLPMFASYSSKIYSTEWGEHFDLNNPHIRNFILDNAKYWLDEFHFDGFRLDATQNIRDDLSPHIIKEITNIKPAIYIGENEPQDIALITTQNLSALWNDDFHHSARVALTGNNEAYYQDYMGSPQEFISSIKHGFLFQGQNYSWQNQPRGTSSLNLPKHFHINFLENHDQIANSANGKRLHQLSSPSLFRALSALLFLAPQTPHIFQGQEYNEPSPFQYFADIKNLNDNIYQGRKEFLSQFPSINNPPPINRFHSSKLTHNHHIPTLNLYKDLIKLRKSLNFHLINHMDGAVLSDHSFVIRYFYHRHHILILTNLHNQIRLQPAPEPLLAPIDSWEPILSTEDPIYDGQGIHPDFYVLQANSLKVYITGRK